MKLVVQSGAIKTAAEMEVAFHAVSHAIFYELKCAYIQMLY